MKNKVPKLRFPEFSGEWEEKKLEKIAEVNPKTGVVPEKFIYVDLESVENGLLKNENIILKNEAPSRAQRVLKNNDILYQTVRPYQKNNFYFENVNKIYPFVASTGYAQLRTSQSSKYLYHFLHTDKFVDSVLERCTGTSYPAINSSDLKLIKINFPSLPEQEKIASFLSKVDESIEILEEEKELWEKYKKGMMQKIFSQKLRFKDENGNNYPEWEEKKLGEVCNYTKGFAFKSQDYQSEGIRIVRVSDLGKERIKEHNEQIYICKSKKEEFSKYNIEKGNIIITTVGSHPDLAESAVGRAILIKDEYSGFLNQNMLKLENGFNYNEFIYGCLSNAKYTGYIKDIKRGNANQANITVSDLLEYKVNLPSLPEQEKIANFLSSIDEKIELIEKELEGVKEFKKGLLQQMFI